MIAASEPLEFVPHGRTVLENHPGKIYSKSPKRSLSENSLLYKLTNFAIKDESLVGQDVSEQEWWCVREVFAKKNEDFIDDTPTPKETKEDCIESSESFRPPSRLKNEFNISIKSELMAGIKKMDTDSGPGVAGSSRGGSANSSSNMSKKFNLNCTLNNSSTTKPLNPKTDSCYEEELYVKGCTAVWSKGLISSPATRLSNPETRETISCYTLENPIKHAVFCNFYVSINNTMLIDALNSQIGDVKKSIKIEDTTKNLDTKNMPSIVLVDNKNLRVYAMDGREYVTSIPFQVKKVWPMKYGVLFEKDATPLTHNSLLPASFLKLNDSQNSTFAKSPGHFPYSMSAKLRQESMSAYDQDVILPTCFSMSHPLDEVTPLLMKSPSHGLQYYNDGDLQIIFVSADPSIVLIYDWKLGTHSLWCIRKALRDECLAMCPNPNSTTIFSQSCDFPGSPMNSFVKNATSWGAGSPFQSRKFGTPPLSRSRINSPMANVLHQQGLSPHASLGQASSMSMMGNFTVAPPSLPLYPDICLDHIWTDSQSIRRDSVENRSDMKSFLHTDLVGHNYLCFMVRVSRVSRLQIVRLQKSHACGRSGRSTIIVGSVSSVVAKDAAVLDHLNMIALIDESGNIILQSGTSVVGKVHVGGVLARLIDSPYTKRPALQSPFPRRSSLLPSRSDASLFDDSALHLLSPVPHSSATRIEQKETLGLHALCDAVGSRLTLVFDKQLMYRINLPDISCSAQITKCCAALKAILPKDVTMQVLIKWYGVRNAPGTQDLSPEQEWSMFANLLYSLIGYDLEKLALPKRTDETNDNTEVATKKQRTSSDGTQDDWEYLLTSKIHRNNGDTLANLLHLTQTKSDAKARPLHRKKSGPDDKTVQFNANSLLFPHTAQLLYALHLVYEDTKLNTLSLNELVPLSKFLCQLARDLRLEKYVMHYWLDHPLEHCLEIEDQESQMTEGHLKRLLQPAYFTPEPPNYFAYLNAMFQGVDAGLYPHLVDVNNMSRDLIEILSTLGCGRGAGTRPVSGREVPATSTPRGRRDHAATSTAHRRRHACALMADRDINESVMESLPAAVRVLLEPLLRAELNHVTIDDQHGLSSDLLEKETVFTMCKQAEFDSRPADPEPEVRTGLEHLDTKLFRLLYPRDHRMSEVFNLLQSSIPVNIHLTQRPEVSDHDFIEEQEKYLYALTTRTTALPIARGMVSLRSQQVVPTEPPAVPPLCVSGRGPPPRTATIEAGAESPALCWPSFHNGAAAGLAAQPAFDYHIIGNYFPHHYTKGTAEMANEHAGFLLALGLNGHLKDMPYVQMYDYLVKGQVMINVGLLLGLAAVYKGTMDVQATKLVSVHISPAVEGHWAERDARRHVAAAALLAAGLLALRTGHAHSAHALAHQICKPPGPEMENCMEREGYALAAGLALGFVYVGAGSEVPSYITQTMRTYMLGGDPQSKQAQQKDKYKMSSFAIRENSTVNLDVTSPGATLALGIMYLGSGNAGVASWLSPPTTSYLLDAVRPDLLMLRCIARGLVLWKEVEPDEEWIERQVPDTIKPYYFAKPTDDNIDYETMTQAYCNIVAGACFTIGLRFAGSGNEDARDALLYYTNFFLTLAGKNIGELAGRSTLESCLCVCLLAAGMVMSGRGDVAVLRVCRRLRARPSPSTSSPAAASPTAAAARARALCASHGPQMAVHMTIGLLFIGGGRCTLSSSYESVAVLLAAFFPKFPTHTDDNRYHLQAFRHLYVLAVEPRLLLPRDLNTGRLCYAHIQVVDIEGAVKEMKAPCLLPQLDSLKEVRVHEPRYWPVVFTRETNWDQLEKLLMDTWCVEIKPRAGCLSYLDDPQGFQTLLAQTLTLDKSNIWSATLENIELFTSDEKVRSFTKHYLSSLKDSKANVGPNICPDCLVLDRKKRKGRETLVAKVCQCRKYSTEELEFVQALSMVTYECVVKDVLCALPVWTTILKIVRTMKTDPSTYHIWQIKLLLSQLEYHHQKSIDNMKVDDEEVQPDEPVISSEFTLSISQKIGDIFDGFEQKIQPYLRKYLGLPSSRKISHSEDQIKKILAAYLVYYDLPKGVFRGVSCDNTLALMLELEGLQLSAHTVSKIEALL